MLDALARDATFAFIDLEMTGLDTQRDRICEVAVVRTRGREVIDEFVTLVHTDHPMHPGAQRVHGITPKMLVDAPHFEQLASSIRGWLEGAIVISHNVWFDLEFLHTAFERIGKELPPPICVDTLLMSRRLFAFPSNSLVNACDRMGIPLQTSHRALADARATCALYHAMAQVVDPDPSSRVTVRELNDLLGALAPNSPLRLRQRQQLREALRSRTTVWIDYQGTSSPREGLIHREVGIWRLRPPKLQGWCYLRGSERVFRLDRIREVWPGVKPYDVPDDYDPRV